MMEEEEFDESESDDQEGEGDTVHLVMASPVILERRRLPDDEDRPEIAIVGSYLEGRLIARCAAEPDWSPKQDAGLFDTPRQLVYQGEELKDKTIRAQMLALIPAQDLPREPWQAEPDEEAPAAFVLLGVVVRLPADRSEKTLQDEYLSHFLSIIGGNAEPVVDRILKSL